MTDGMPPNPTPVVEHMSVLVKLISGVGKIIYVAHDDTLATLKAKVEVAFGTPKTLQKLVHGGKMLEPDEMLLSESRVKHEDKVFVVVIQPKKKGTMIVKEFKSSM